MKTKVGYTILLAAIGLCLAACTSTGHVSIVKPSADKPSLNSPLDIRVKHEGCGQPVAGSFKAWFNKGKENQQDISKRFILSGNEWIAQDIRLGRGTHTLEVDADIEGSGCSKSYSRQHQVRTFMVTGGEELEFTMTLPSAATIAPDSERKTIIAVQDADGDAVHVVLPAAAAPDVTEVVLEVIAPQLANIPASAILLGFRLTPDDTRLARKGQMLIRSVAADRVARTRLYFVKANGRLLPLPNQRVSSGVLIADLHHFSTVVVAELSAEQFSSQVDRSSADGSYDLSAGMDAYEEQIRTDLEVANEARRHGNDDYANEILQNIRESIELAIQARLDALTSGEPSCDQIDELVTLNVLGELAGVSADILDAVHEHVKKCVTGTLAHSIEASFGANIVSSQCLPALPFSYSDGRLSGEGKSHCVLQWQQDFDEGRAIFDFDILTEFRIEGRLDGLTLKFEPPTIRAIGGYGKITLISPELGTMPMLDTVIEEGTVIADTPILGRMTYPSPEDSLGYGLTFAIKQNDTFEHTEVHEGSFFRHTWRLCLNGAVTAKIDVAEGLINKNNEIALGRTGVEFSLTNLSDKDCRADGWVVKDDIDNRKTSWKITGVDAKEITSPTVQWDTNQLKQAVIEVTFDDIGDPVDDAPQVKSMSVTVVKPTGETNESNGWSAPLLPTLHEWKSTLTSDSDVNFDGIEVTEVDPDLGEDECWNKIKAAAAPEKPQLPPGFETERKFDGVSKLTSEERTQKWTVGNHGHNVWCCDKNFVGVSVIEYYRNQGVTPCTIRIPQHMHVVVPNRESVVYEVKSVIEYRIGPTTLESCRLGECELKSWP